MNDSDGGVCLSGGGRLLQAVLVAPGRGSKGEKSGAASSQEHVVVATAVFERGAKGGKKRAGCQCGTDGNV